MQRHRLRRRAALAALAALTALASGLVGHAAPAVSAVAPQSSVCTTTVELSDGARGAPVACLQYFLALSGLYVGELTSTYNPAVTAAVKAYQLAHAPLVANGIAGKDTLTAMGLWSSSETPRVVQSCKADADVLPGDGGPGPQCVQRRLNELGLFQGKADGVMGKDTVDALKAFQSKNPPLKLDGIGSSTTLAALGIWSGRSAGDVVPSKQSATPIVRGGPWPAQLLDYPNWNRTSEGIPYYGQGHACSRVDADIIATQFANDGADVSTQQWAVYIASREGGCNFRAVNLNPATRDDSHCTFQLNALAGIFEPHGELGRRGWTTDSVKESMQNCADAASDLWVYCGKGPWTPPYRCLQPWENDLGPGGDA